MNANQYVKGRKMENIASLLGEAAILMVTGMAFVFLFLTILVYIVSFLAKVIPQEQPMPVATTARKPNTPISPVTGTNPKVIAAISAAVSQYRSSSSAKK